MNSNYCDLSTIAGVSRFSGGSVYHYPNFHYDPELHGPPSDSSAEEESETGVQQGHQGEKMKVPPHELCDFVEVERLRKDFKRYLTRKIGFEAVLRIRTSRGISIQVRRSPCLLIFTCIVKYALGLKGFLSNDDFQKSSTLTDSFKIEIFNLAAIADDPEHRMCAGQDGLMIFQSRRP